MARPSRNNVDYFPHPVEHGSGMFYIENKYGNDGYAVWFKLLERLGKAEYHYLDLSNESELMFLSAKCKVSEDVLKSIILDLSKLGHFHIELWKEYSILWNQKFVDSISDAYNKRNNKCISFNGLLDLLYSLGIHKPSKITLDSYGKPQSKVKDTKEDKIVYTYDSFYDSEIKQIQDIESEGYGKWYVNLVKYIFGEYDNGVRLDNCLKFKEQIRYNDFIKLIKKHDSKKIKEQLLNIGNSAKAYKNNTNLYLTLNNWCNKY